MITSMLILLLAMLALIYLFMFSMRETLYQTQSITATDLAVEQIEALKAKPFHELVSGNEENISGYPEFRRTWSVQIQADNPELKKITVLVEWKNKNIKTLQITLTTFVSSL
jgi:Tfp pilus assembly protein PilV